jgi:hypothetical protein
MLKCPRCGELNGDKELYCAKCDDRLPSLSSLRSTLRAGLDALDRKDYKTALDRFTDIIRNNPGDRDAWFLRAATLMKLGNGMEAWADLVESGIAEQKDKCRNCRGTGKCPECGQTGICIMCRGTKRCSYCGGAGICPTCKGQKIEECIHCKRTGVCIRCKGSKECNYCNGYGTCMKCKGTGNCQICGGTGRGYRINSSKISTEHREMVAWFN